MFFLKNKKIQQWTFQNQEKIKLHPKRNKIPNYNQIKTSKKKNPTKACGVHYILVSYSWAWGLSWSGLYTQCHSGENGFFPLPAGLSDSSVVKLYPGGQVLTHSSIKKVSIDWPLGQSSGDSVSVRIPFSQMTLAVSSWHKS